MPAPAPAPTSPPAAGASGPVDRRIQRVTRQDRRGLVYIIGIAIAVHVFIGYLLFRPVKDIMPKTSATASMGMTEVSVDGLERPVELKENFVASATSYKDEATGETVIERNFTFDLRGSASVLNKSTSADGGQKSTAPSTITTEPASPSAPR